MERALLSNKEGALELDQNTLDRLSRPLEGRNNGLTLKPLDVLSSTLAVYVA